MTTLTITWNKKTGDVRVTAPPHAYFSVSVFLNEAVIRGIDEITLEEARSEVSITMHQGGLAKK